MQSDNWGVIADYDSLYDDYELSAHEYVVYDHHVFYPEIDVNVDIPQIEILSQIPHKLGEEKKPITDWQMATFQTNYDPYQDPWLT